jgi:hypothetical protein
MKLIDRRVVAVVAAALSLTACVTPPLGPTIAVAPGPNKSFDAFAADQATCQQYASAQTAPEAYAATNQGVGGALLSTALGAGLGAAIGAAAGSAGTGAAIGAASGAVLGTAAGAGGAGYAQLSLQQQFDVMYGQCMYAQGNQVPGLSPPPPGSSPYAGTPGPSPYPQGTSPYGPGPSPYGPAPSPYGPGPSPYGPPPYPGMPVPPPG